LDPVMEDVQINPLNLPNQNSSHFHLSLISPHILVCCYQGPHENAR
jgi:hypothetical protein